MAHSIASLEMLPLVLAGSAVGSFTAHLDGVGVFVRDQEYGGNHRVQGTVALDDTPTDVPLRRQVVLFVQPSMNPLRSVWSEEGTGAYEFPLISNRYKYSVVAFDYEQNYRAVIADNLTPEAMP